MNRPYSRVIEAVAAIAEKLGATVTSTGNRLADNLEAISKSDIGGSGLPDPSEATAGDVLTVVDGAWAPAAPSGGGPLVVNVDYEYHETYETYTCDKTFAEIYAAGSAGSAVFVYKIFGSDCMDYVLHMYTNGQNDNFIFVGTFRDDGNGYIVFKTLQYDAMTENDYPVCTVTFDSEPSEP